MPLIRLSTASNMEADPGCYELWQCVQTLRRMLHKQSHMLCQWQIFMAGYDGCIFHGPFSKLILLFSKIGWSVLKPPCIQDHDGLVHDLMFCPSQLLRRLLEQAWLMYVSNQVQHRRTMADVKGLDLALLSEDCARLNPLESSLHSALRSGAFTFRAQQAKFDLSQDGQCPHCHELDNAYHRVCVCPQYSRHRQGFEWICEAWPSLPKSLPHHLLPSRNPHVPRLQELLQSLADRTSHFLSQPSDADVQQFTDGACEKHGHTTLALAAWGLVLGDTGQVVSSGHLPGVLQTAPRAELSLLLFGQTPRMWFQGCWSVRQDMVISPMRIMTSGYPSRRFSKQLLDELVKVFHVQSHLSLELTRSPFEDWVATHNGHADQVAGMTITTAPPNWLRYTNWRCSITRTTSVSCGH